MSKKIKIPIKKKWNNNMGTCKVNIFVEDYDKMKEIQERTGRKLSDVLHFFLKQDFEIIDND